MTEPYVHPYIPNTAPEVRAEMLAAVGATSVDEFYADVPEALRLGRSLDLPEPLVAEQDLVRHVSGLLARNVPTTERLSFLDLVEADAVGGIQNPLPGKTGVEGEPDLVDRAAVDVRAEAADVFQYVYVGEGLAGVEEDSVAVLEGGSQFSILRFDSFGVIGIQRGSELPAEADEVFRG